VACRLSIGGCSVVVTVDDAGGADRQREVADALAAVQTDLALLAVDALRTATQQHAEGWAVADPPAVSTTPAPVPGLLEDLPLPRTRAWLDAVQASGGPPPPPPQGMPALELAVPPPPPPKAPMAEAPAASSAVASGTTTPTAPGATDAHEWEERLAFATTSGAAVAAALAAEVAPPAPPKWTLPLRNRVWAAVGGLPTHVGIYGTWSNGGEEAAASCAVWGFPSLGEAKAFAQGFGVELPDRRR
jgi:hypothetical protein